MTSRRRIQDRLKAIFHCHRKGHLRVALLLPSPWADPS
nr:MAG TPA: hypothetical protein [Caudoviricetes sp.]